MKRFKCLKCSNWFDVDDTRVYTTLTYCTLKCATQDAYTVKGDVYVASTKAVILRDDLINLSEDIELCDETELPPQPVCVCDFSRGQWGCTCGAFKREQQLKDA